MFDMSSTVFSYGAPELNLCVAALADLGHYYRLPIYGTAGCSDSKLCDQQAAIESALTVYTAALSGANLVHDTGLLESAMTLSLEMMVMTDEIIGRVRKIMGGFEINKETLALDVINRVGPGGHFLAEEHTLEHFRKAWYPTVSDRRRFDDWVAEGSLSMGDRLNGKVKEIIRTHRCEPLGEDVVKELAKLEKSWR
jgi:trimethylamine--corrinoid protein Co-methyltransferase